MSDGHQRNPKARCEFHLILSFHHVSRIVRKAQRLDADTQRRILLADFGIGREIAHTSGLTATNMTIGTVSYAVPEQLMGESIDGRADQYALGATAFHLLTGHPVFDHSNPAVVISRHLNAAPPSLSDRRSELAALDRVVKTCTRQGSGDRFACCADFAQELRATAERTEGLGDDTGRSARTQVVSGSTVSPTAPTQLAPISGRTSRNRSSVAWRIGIFRAAPSPPRTHRRVAESASTPFEIPELFKTTRPFPSSRVPDQREPREAPNHELWRIGTQPRPRLYVEQSRTIQILGHAFTNYGDAWCVAARANSTRVRHLALWAFFTAIDE